MEVGISLGWPAKASLRPQDENEVGIWGPWSLGGALSLLLMEDHTSIPIPQQHPGQVAGLI